jgi:hypothetical protein
VQSSSRGATGTNVIVPELSGFLLSHCGLSAFLVRGSPA